MSRERDLLRPAQSANKTGESAAGTEFEDVLPVEKGGGVLLEVLGDDHAGVP